MLVAIGFGVGAFGTLIGAGGGFILTPILLLLYPHDSPRTITAISLAVVFFNAASGTAAYARQRRIDYRSGIVFALATLPGAVGGALVVGSVSRHVFDGIMGAVLAVLAAWLVAGERWPLPVPHGISRRARSSIGLVRHVYQFTMRGALYSLGVGFLSSFLGIGGGVIHVPLLVRALGFPITSRPRRPTSSLPIMAEPGRSRTSGRAASARPRLASNTRPLGRRRRRRPTRRTRLAPAARRRHPVAPRARAPRPRRSAAAGRLKIGRNPRPAQ